MIKRWVLLSVLSVAGCTLGPDYVRPGVDTPPAWRAIETSPSPAANDIAWWRQFDDPVLDRLVALALDYNQDIVVAAARVDEAAAAAQVARANLLPRLDGAASYAKGRASTYTAVPGAPAIAQVDTAAATLSWEVDLWGKLRRGREAALANFAASRYAFDGARLSLAALVAQTYFQLLAFDAQETVAEASLSSRLQSLALREARFRGGMTSALDWHQAQAQADAARVIIPSLRHSIEQTEHALAILVGVSPREMMMVPERGNVLIDQRLPLVLPVGLPSELLDRRPDLAEAEQRVVAANAQIGVARAAYFPSISLTGTTGSQSTALANLFTGPARVWNVGANATAPIIDFGATAANVDAAVARQQQALAQYRHAIQTAFKDALDALSAQRTSVMSEAAQQDKLQAVRESLRLSQLRYDNGYSPYLDVLDAERDDFQAELDLVQARLDRLDAAVDLFKALGGGWSR